MMFKSIQQRTERKEAEHCGDEHGSGVEQQFIQDNRCNGRTHLPKRGMSSFLKNPKTGHSKA